MISTILHFSLYVRTLYSVSIASDIGIRILTIVYYQLHIFWLSESLKTNYPCPLCHSICHHESFIVFITHHIEIQYKKYFLSKMLLLTLMEHSFLHDRILYLVFGQQARNSNGPFFKKTFTSLSWINFETNLTEAFNFASK